MTPIQYVKGDATYPQGEGRKIIAHICNDIGAWGAGFVLALSARSFKPEKAYGEWAMNSWNERHGCRLPLGDIQIAPYVDDLLVANMIAQHGVGSDEGIPLIRYLALAGCLHKLRRETERYVASVHMPRIGCGLAGGDWGVVELLISRYLSYYNVAVTVYDL